MIKKAFLILVVLVLNAVGLFVTFVLPWPTYGASTVTDQPYYTKALKSMDEFEAQTSFGSRPGPLSAGWAQVSLTPPIGTPLAGYGDRQGRPSTGTHDELDVRVLALRAGNETVYLLGSDMLIVPENVTDEVRARVWESAQILPGQILFNASHTHSGPGAWGPGFLAKQFSGEFDPEIVAFLVDKFATAIEAAGKNLEPAKLGYGSVTVPESIRNRTREAPVDDELSFLVVRQEDGDTCHVVNYSAHATVLGGSNMEFSADYPGYILDAIEEETGGFAMFMSGAVGSMGPRTPDLPQGATGFDKAEAMGRVLAKRVLESAQDLELEAQVELASMGIPLELPPFQLRLSTKWRVSPYLLPLLGLDTDGWLHGLRINDLVMLGAPCDFSGELSREMKIEAAAEGRDLWCLSFNGDYAGYISPDKYYLTADKDEEGYEMYVMSWCGPNQSAFFCGLMDEMADRLVDSSEGSS